MLLRIFEIKSAEQSLGTFRPATVIGLGPAEQAPRVDRPPLSLCSFTSFHLPATQEQRSLAIHPSWMLLLVINFLRDVSNAIEALRHD
jgi:hypothetical protein